MKRRLLAVLMTICMLFGLSGIGVYAAEEEATWQYETPMPNASGQSASVVVDNKIYVIAGYVPSASIWLDTVNIYDTATSTWTTGKNMPTKRSIPTASTWEKKIYVIGGSNATNVSLNTLDIYDTTTNTWTTGAPMPTARFGASSIALDGKIYVMGGSTAYPTVLNKVEIYDTKTNTWTTGTSMPTGRTYFSSEIVGDKIYLIGGSSVSDLQKPIKTVDIYDTTTNTWTTGAPMLTERTALVSEQVDNKIYTIGGYDQSSKVTKTVEIYDITTNTWMEGTSLLNATAYLASAVVEGKIYAIGGFINGDASKTVESIQLRSTIVPTKYLLAVLLNVDEQVQLSVTHNLVDNIPLTWSSTDDAVATVDCNGKVTAVGEGLTYIYAENDDGAFKEFIPVRVVFKQADEMRLAVHLTVGERVNLYLSDNTENITWSSLDDSVATISDEGQVTGLSKGLAIIQGEIDGETYQIYVRVNG